MKTIESTATVRDIAEAKETKETARFKPQYFTRNRVMTFSDVIYFLLNPAKECLQIRLNNFFKKLGKNMRISQQALSATRSHFDHSPFEKMARKHVELEYDGKYDDELETWNGYHVFAVDGSAAILPNSPELKEVFGVSGCESNCATAGVSILVDILHDWIIDAHIGSYPQDERKIARGHIDFLCEHMERLEKKIVLFDRGYPSLDMIAYLHDKGIKHLMRCQKSWLSEVERLPMGDSTCMLKNGHMVRVYKFRLASGEVETLLTNLYETPSDELPGLYFMRWGVEGKYDVLKNKLELENFSGYSKNAILQDFWVSITLSIIIAIVKKEAHQKIQERTSCKNNRRKQAPNVSQLIGTLKDDFVFACRLPTDALRKAVLDALMKDISRAVTPIRPDRTARPRKNQSKKKQYPINRKSNI